MDEIPQLTWEFSAGFVVFFLIAFFRWPEMFTAGLLLLELM